MESKEIIIGEIIEKAEYFEILYALKMLDIVDEAFGLYLNDLSLKELETLKRMV